MTIYISLDILAIIGKKRLVNYLLRASNLASIKEYALI